MGYDLHITRGDTAPISETEWRAYVARDPELELTGAAEAPVPGGVLRYENPGLSCWLGHPRGEKVWLDLRGGCVVVKNPDEPTIAKLVAIAAAIHARVVGDDGEIYGSPGAEPRQPRVSLAARLRSLFGRLRPLGHVEPVHVAFGAGQRVRDFRGQLGTVRSVDLAANRGLGSIQVHFDDGRELTVAASAHGLTAVEEAAE